MRARLKNKLPKRFVSRTPGLVTQKSLRIYGTSLRAMVVVFKRPKDLHAFWAKQIGQNLGTGCWGAVHSLARHIERVNPDGSTTEIAVEYDRRHFCLIGLVRTRLGMRLLSHECVHAGFCHAKRVKRSGWQAQATRFDEEAIAYPAGEVARSLVEWLRREDLV